MHTLAVIRHTRSIYRAMRSIRIMILHSSLDALWLRTPAVTGGRRYEDGICRLQLARDVFLAGPWDSMLIIDDDLVVPQTAYEQLAYLDMPVAYALTVQRRAPHQWSAMVAQNGSYKAISRYPERARAAWGAVIPVAGCGNNPTLIKRDVIEQIPFEQRGPHGADRYFAYDCMEKGIEMVCDMGLLVGHHDGETCWFPSVNPYHFRGEQA